LTGDGQLTLRGLTMGRLTVMKPSAHPSCVVVAHSFPSWLFVLEELRLNPVLVVLTEDTYVAAIQQLVPSSCRILIGTAQDTSRFLSADWHRGLVGLVDGSITSSTIALFESCGVQRIFFTQRLRRSISGWYHSNVTIPHIAVGGVSRFQLQLNVLSRTDKMMEVPTPAIAPRDVSTVLSIKPSS
jgi:hypothetical protein